MATTVLKQKNKILDTKTLKCTCDFMGYKGHKGVDLIPESTSETPWVFAIADGVVIDTANVSEVNKSKGIAGCGTYIAIRCDGGLQAIVRYQHLKYNSLRVKKGDRVRKGDKLAHFGRPTNGNSSGPHLHWDISFPVKRTDKTVSGSWAGETRYYIDPKPYIAGMDVNEATTKANLNVRLGPGTNYAVVDELKAGTKVVALSKSSNWVKLGEGRWVSIKYLK